ncbi:aminotransferase, partial [Streptomyces sp. V2]
MWRGGSGDGVPDERRECGWESPSGLAVLDRTLAAEPGVTHVGLVQHETGTGQLNPLRGIGEVVARHGR